MGLFGNRKPEEKAARDAAVRKYDAAQDELERVSKRDRKNPDDDAWNKANDAVWETRNDVPWWRR